MSLGYLEIWRNLHNLHNLLQIARKHPLYTASTALPRLFGAFSRTDLAACSGYATWWNPGFEQTDVENKIFATCLQVAPVAAFRVFCSDTQIDEMEGFHQKQCSTMALDWGARPKLPVGYPAISPTLPALGSLALQSCW